MRSPTQFRALPIKARRINRGHSFQLRPPTVVAPPAAAPPSSPPVVVRLRKNLVQRPPLQFRRAGHSLGAPAVVAIPQFPLLTVPAVLTLSAPPPAPKISIPPPPPILRQFVRTNLLPNSGFESGTSGWNNSGGAVITADIGQFHSGAQSGVVVQTLAAQTTALIFSDPIPVRPGERFSLSGWARGENVDKCALFIAQYDATEATSQSTSAGTGNLTPGTWTQQQVQNVAMQPWADHIRVGLQFSLQSLGNLPTGVALGQWDDLQVEYGAVATTLIPTNGGIASGHGITIAVPAVPGILTLSAPAPGLGQDITVVAPAAVLNLSAPLSSPSFAFPTPPGLLTLSAPSPGILTLSAIPPVPAANLVLSMPVPCLKRTLGFSIVTPGVLALEPLLPADTCQ